MFILNVHIFFRFIYYALKISTHIDIQVNNPNEVPILITPIFKVHLPHLNNVQVTKYAIVLTFILVYSTLHWPWDENGKHWENKYLPSMPREKLRSCDVFLCCNLKLLQIWCTKVLNPIFAGKLGAPPKFSSFCRFWCINVVNWIFVVKLGALRNLILIALNYFHFLWIWSFDPLVIDFSVSICYVFILLGSNFVTCIIYGSKLLTNFSNNNVDNFYFFG